MKREKMNIAIVGHVDHGKSTVVGRLLADTGSLPQGKLEQVKAMCAKNARPFEYAFLLDALKDEQAQGITIDAARCFFKTARRDYIVIDAPGHIEFLKNMVTGAARAEAAILVIDAKEGVQENSRRHGYLVSMLGIKQVVVLVNKMDLVGYDEKVFTSIEKEYSAFLKPLNVFPIAFIPIAAREGENITQSSSKMKWSEAPTVLAQLDAFEQQEARTTLPFRFPVQDIYKFTAEGDERRIVAGTVETGSIQIEDEVLFLPSGKRSVIKSREEFNKPTKNIAEAGEAVGFTLTTQIYIQRGELMVKASEKNPPLMSSRFKANIFWMSHAPMIPGKTYKLKLAATRSPVKLVQILNVLDASELDSVQNKQQVERHDVAECILETAKPIAFDRVSDIESTGRFVLVDNYEIAGGGIVLESISDRETTLKDHVKEREFSWVGSSIPSAEREAVYQHKAKFIVIAGPENSGKLEIAKALEKRLFEAGMKAYYLGISDVIQGLDSDLALVEERLEHIRRMGELARILTDSGQIFITTISNVDDYDIETLRLLNAPSELFVVTVDEPTFTKYPIDVKLPARRNAELAATEIVQALNAKQILPDYSI